jgi:hypothetical protein
MMSESKLKVINIGAGTTGTRDLARLICKEFGVVTLHHTAVCNTNYHGITEQFAPLKWYFDVEAFIFLKFYHEVLLDAVLNYDFLTDDPLAQLIQDVLTIVPNISVLSTIRDPVIWARRRKEQHMDAVICHPDLWTFPGVLHPFDFIGCLHAVSDDNKMEKKKKLVGDALVTIQNISEASLASAFIQYNTISLHQVLAARRPLQVFCFWDYPYQQKTLKKQPSSPVRTTQRVLNNFWKDSNTTRCFLKHHHRTTPRDIKMSKLRTNRLLTKFSFGNDSSHVDDPHFFPSSSHGLDDNIHNTVTSHDAFYLFDSGSNRGGSNSGSNDLSQPQQQAFYHLGICIVWLTLLCFFLIFVVIMKRTRRRPSFQLSH